MKQIPLIYKKSKRYSVSQRPEIGARCMFSHADQLIFGEFVPHPKAFERSEIYQGARCMVLGLSTYVVRVRFDGSDLIDLVSPEFLIPMELTKFGEDLLNSDMLDSVETIIDKEQKDETN